MDKLADKSKMPHNYYGMGPLVSQSVTLDLCKALNDARAAFSEELYRNPNSQALKEMIQEQFSSNIRAAAEARASGSKTMKDPKTADVLWKMATSPLPDFNEMFGLKSKPSTQKNQTAGFKPPSQG